MDMGGKQEVNRLNRQNVCLFLLFFTTENLEVESCEHHRYVEVARAWRLATPRGVCPNRGEVINWRYKLHLIYSVGFLRERHRVIYRTGHVWDLPI